MTHNMAGDAVLWPSLCGNRTEYDAFWDPELTLETFYPMLTDCFKKTVLVWVPCAWLWVASLFYVPFLYRRETVRWTCQLNCNLSGISRLNLWKTVLSVLAKVMSVVDLVQTIVHATDPNSPESTPPAEYSAAIITIASLMLALFLTHYSHRKGIRTSGVLIIFWLLLTLCKALTAYSDTMQHLQEKVDFDFGTVSSYVYFGLGFLISISSTFSDHPVLKKALKPKAGEDTERTPLLGTTDQPQDTATTVDPHDTAGFLSRATFFWFTSLVVKGYKKPLTYADIGDIRPEDASKTIVNKFSTNWEKEVRDCARTNKEPSLNKVLVMSFAGTLFMAVFLLILGYAFQLLTPILLNLVIDFVQSDNPYVWQGYLLAVGMFLCTVLTSILMNQSVFMSYHVGMHLKSAIITAVYRKSLRLSNGSRKTVSTGEIVNLMSVDAQKVQDSQMYINFLLVSPLVVTVVISMLYQKLGPSCFVGFAYLILVIPINSFLVGKLITRYQRLQMRFKDGRIKLMTQILAGIKVLKLYAWEPYFEKKISSLRAEELTVLRKGAIVMTLNYILTFSSTFMVMLLCFMTYVLSSPDHVLTPDVAFVSMSLFGVLTLPMLLIPTAIMLLINAVVSIARIKKFLLLPEINVDNVQHDPFKGGAVRIEDGQFSWGETDRIPLKNINLVVPEGSLIAVVGTVGAGKSSLIQAMLGEMEVLQGSVNVKGSVAYVPQQAWIQNLTVRDNILFNKTYLRHKYDPIIEACALDPDLKILSGGDMTEIGDRGINLSGGQKQRVSVARAVYQNADIYLLDDPLSAVDSHVGKHIFEKVVGPYGILARKTRVLVTNALTFLPKVDKIVVLKEQTISEMGSYDELLDRNGAFAEFVKEHLSQNDDSDDSDPERETFWQQLFQRMSSIYTHSEDSVSGTDGGTSASEERKVRRRANKKRRLTLSNKMDEEEHEKKKRQALIVEEALEEGSIKREVITSYVKAASLAWTIAAFCGLAIQTGGLVFSNIWLSVWSNDAAQSLMPNGTEPVSISVRLGVYGAIGVSQTIGVAVLLVAVAYGCIEAARYLHGRLLTNNLRCPMAFFDTTPLGRILNRFSKDVDTVDADLRLYIQNWLWIMGNIVSTLIIIIYSTPLLVVVIIPLVAAFFFLQRVYIATARQIKRIDSIKRSPIYSNFSETLNGVSSIRAYNQERRFVETADRLLDNSQKVWFPVITSNRWISVCADMLVGIIILFAAIFCIVERKTIDAGTVGLSLAFALQIGNNIVSAVRFSCELETYIVAVERLKEYSETKTEAPWSMSPHPPSDWPANGVINFNKYKTRYREGLDLVLKGLSCHINAGEMVGIVGRTGAGKSSLTLALFRIIEAAEGSIVIDGLNTADMGLHDLRSKLTIIPQDPVLFSGSLRFNVDPADQYSDAEVWTALEQAHLKEFVAGLPETLMYESGEEGLNFSVGQRQLICLARALLRKTKILVLDEATAAVDLETDDLIQTTIRMEFKGCTVLTIAHRLNTIMDYDKVMVMDAGLIKEFDTPQMLLQESTSMFYGMAKDAGLV